MDPADMNTGFKYEWKGPLKDPAGRIYVGDCRDNSLYAESHLRRQTTPDGSKFRYVQTFYEKPSEQPGEKKWPVNAEKLLVGSWLSNPSVRSTSDRVSAEEDDSPQIPLPEKEVGWMVVDQRRDVGDDQEWMKVAGYRWETVHKTRALESYVLPESEYPRQYEGYRKWGS